MDKLYKSAYNNDAVLNRLLGRIDFGFDDIGRAIQLIQLSRMTIDELASIVILMSRAPTYIYRLELFYGCYYVVDKNSVNSKPIQYWNSYSTANCIEDLEEVVLSLMHSINISHYELSILVEN